MNNKIFTLTLILNCFLIASAEKTNFSWHTTEDKYTDLLHGKKKIARYVHERMIPEDRERTYKPFHHIYDRNGKSFITKGPGGKFSHHRGIFFGFSKCSVLDGQGKKVSVDTWHCKRGHQVHEKFLEITANDKMASHTSEISWKVDDGTIFAKEKRTLTFSFENDMSLIIDFKSTIETDQNQITLDGDPQHAGFQFRASNEVFEKTSKKTFYVRPVDGKDDMGKTKNWPQNKEMTNLEWKGQSVVLGDDRYFTLYLDHPNNPKPSYYSERDYGRFGSYFKTQVSPDTPLQVNYRLHLSPSELSVKSCKEKSRVFAKFQPPTDHLSVDSFNCQTTFTLFWH